jgi:DNA-binding response OmpR family regulator
MTTTTMSDPATRPLVLVVDDDHDIVDLISEYLTTGYRIRSAADGAAALNEFALERPDVVLLDLNMPRMNGLEAQVEMRSRDPEVPIIMLTGVQDVALLAQALKNGAFSYLPKPFHREYLVHLLAAALSQRRDPRR